MAAEARIPRRYITLEYASLADGATAERTYTSTKDVEIELMMAVKADGTAWKGSTLTIKKGEEVITKEKIPASVLGDTWNKGLRLDLPLSAHEEFKVALTNGEGATITAYVVLSVKEA